MPMLVVADERGIWQWRFDHRQCCSGGVAQCCWLCSLAARSAPDTEALAPLLAIDNDGGVAGLGARLARALGANDVPDAEAAAPLVAVPVRAPKGVTVGLVVGGRRVGALDMGGDAL